MYDIPSCYPYAAPKESIDSSVALHLAIYSLYSLNTYRAFVEHSGSIFRVIAFMTRIFLRRIDYSMHF